MPLCGAGTLVGCLWHHYWAEVRFTGELRHPQSAPSLLEHHVCTRQRAEPRFQQPDAHVWRGTVLEEAGCCCKVQGCWLSQLGLKKSAATAAAATDPARHAPFTPASRRTQVAAVASCAQLLLRHVCGLKAATSLLCSRSLTCATLALADGRLAFEPPRGAASGRRGGSNTGMVAAHV